MKSRSSPLALHEAIAAGYRAPALRTEQALDPLSARANFQLLIMAVVFPAEQLADSGNHAPENSPR